MYLSETKIRVRYGETDRMGFCYYGNYAVYFEVARVESLRGIGISYKNLEDKGILLPVYDFSIRYFKPAYYDDLLSIKAYIKEMPKTRIIFEYETFNEKSVLLNTAKTTLVFLDKQSNRACVAPNYFIKALCSYFYP